VESFGDFRCACVHKAADKSQYVSVIGKNIFSYNVEDGESKTIVGGSSLPDICSIVALPSGELLAALADSSLMLIPVGMMSTSSAQPVSWPVQPRSILALDKTVLIACEYNLLCEVSQSSLLSSEFSSTLPTKGGNILWSCCSGNNVYAVTLTGSDLCLMNWQREEISSTRSCAWYSPDNVRLKKVLSYSPDRERIVGVCSGSGETVLIVFTGNSSEATDSASQKKKKTQVYLYFKVEIYRLLSLSYWIPCSRHSQPPRPLPSPIVGW